MRPPYLLSSLDKVKDVTLLEIIKDDKLRDQLMHKRDSVLSKLGDGNTGLMSEPLLHNNYSFEISPLFDIQQSQAAIGYVLIVTSSQRNNITSLYEQSMKTSGDTITLRLEKDDDLSAAVEKVIKLCREQFAFSYDKIKDVLNGRKEYDSQFTQVYWSFTTAGH